MQGYDPFRRHELIYALRFTKVGALVGTPIAGALTDSATGDFLKTQIFVGCILDWCGVGFLVPSIQAERLRPQSESTNPSMKASNTLGLPTSFRSLTAFHSSSGRLNRSYGKSNDQRPASRRHHMSTTGDQLVWSCYGHLSYEEFLTKLADSYQLFVTGRAAHCGVNSPHSASPSEGNMPAVINGVENGMESTRLNATVSLRTCAGEFQMICWWPRRPLWLGNSSTCDCVIDETSFWNWALDFPALVEGMVPGDVITGLMLRTDRCD